MHNEILLLRTGIRAAAMALQQVKEVVQRGVRLALYGASLSRKILPLSRESGNDLARSSPWKGYAIQIVVRGRNDQGGPYWHKRPSRFASARGGYIDTVRNVRHGARIHGLRTARNKSMPV